MAKGVKIPYSPKEIKWLEQNKTLPISEYTRIFNKKFSRSVDKVNLHALRKRKGWKTGRTGQFKKGNVPHPDAGAKGPNKTSFKKGHKPANHKPVGYERVTADGTLEVKIAEPNVFAIKSRHMWEQEKGKIPDGFVVFHLDGDALNCKIDNLCLLSRSELVRLNQHQKMLGIRYKDADKSMRESLLALAKLKTKIGDLKND